MGIHVGEIVFPGNGVCFNDKELNSEIFNMLFLMNSQLDKVGVALNFFEGSLRNSAESREDSELRREIYIQIESDLRREKGDDCFRKDRNAMEIERQRRYIRGRQDKGLMPNSYLHHIPFIYANAFLMYLDSFGKFLEELSSYGELPSTIKTIAADFNKSLPSLVKIRNSAAHIEDRIRLYASYADKKKGKRISTNSVGLGNLMGNKLCYMIDDGSNQSIEISGATFSIAVIAMQMLVNALPWEGDPIFRPG